MLKSHPWGTILYPSVLLRIAGTLLQSSPVTHISHAASLPSYFQFQGQVVNAGIISACL